MEPQNGTRSNSSGNRTPPRRQRRRRRAAVVHTPVAESALPPASNSQRPSRSYQDQRPPIQQARDVAPSRERRPARGSIVSSWNSQPSANSEKSAAPVVAPLWLVIPRAVAFFLGSLTLWNLFGERSLTTFPSQFWWIDLELWSPQIARAVMGVAAVSFLLFAAMSQFPRLLRTIAMIATITLLLVSVKNCYQFYQHIESGKIYAVALFPVSIYAGLLLLIILVGLLKVSGLQRETGRAFLLGAFAFLLCLVEFPLAQMYCEGKTDYRREADVAVVFFSRIKGDSNPAVTLKERMQTACDLYKQGLVSRLVLSAGSQKSQDVDTLRMQKQAIEQGVPEADILLNQQKSNTVTQKEIESIAKLISKQQTSKNDNSSESPPTVLVVTHFYQQPRIKFYCDRAGLKVYTIPAHETRQTTLLKSPIATEAINLWKTMLTPRR